MYCPVLRCHQTSGSVTLRAAMANSPRNSAARKTFLVRRSFFTVAWIIPRLGRRYNPEHKSTRPRKKTKEYVSRNRLKTWIALLIVGMLCIHAVLFWKARDLVRQGYPDFTIFYTAGKMLRQGLGHSLYDGALQYQVQQSFASGVRIRKGPLPYNHPPFEALIFLPLASLDYAMAYLA